MKRSILIVLTLICFETLTQAQNMSTTKLGEIITKVSDTVQHQNNVYKFVYKDTILLCMTDENANRMRIVSPIIEIFKLDENQLKNALVANFHTALDVKYAISEDILWSVFIHPLKELNEQQVEDAILQVYMASATFGTTYSSTNLIFPGSAPKEEKKTVKKKELKKT